LDYRIVKRALPPYHKVDEIPIVERSRVKLDKHIIIAHIRDRNPLIEL
jgi:hypothetical protein